MRSMKTMWVMLCLTALLLSACADEPEEKTDAVVRVVKLMTIGDAENLRTVEYPGHVAALRSASLGFEVAGKIVELPIDHGMYVEKGQVLAKLDPRDYVAARNAAKARLDASDAAYQRAKRIFDQGAGSQSEVERALRDLQVSRADLKKTKKALSETVLKSPFSGMVARKISDNYENVQAKEPVLLLLDVSSLELDVNIPEQDILYASTGLSLAERSKRFRPEISVSTIADRLIPARLKSMEAIANDVTRTYKVTLAFENPSDVNILPGMTAHAILHVPEEIKKTAGISGIMIPALAVVSDATNKPHVWRFDAKHQKVHRVDVVLGDLSGAKVLVSKGLQRGDQIVVSGASYLHEGMQVRALQTSEGHP